MSKEITCTKLPALNFERKEYSKLEESFDFGKISKISSLVFKSHYEEQT